MEKKDYARGGTKTWKIDRLREYLLVELFEDLRCLEKNGLTDEECDHVKSCFEEMVLACQKINQGLVKKLLTEPLTNFVGLYKEWNGPRGSTDEAINQRRVLLGRLAKLRRKLSCHLGHQKGALSGLIDDRFADELWANLEAIPKKYPQGFLHLERGFRRVRGVLKKAS